MSLVVCFAISLSEPFDVSVDLTILLWPTSIPGESPLSQEVSRHRAKEMRRSRTKNDVSVIVLTKNSARTLEKCLVSIERERPFEIIAVDGQSKDGTLSILRKHRIKVLSETEEGWGVGFSRQLGVKAAGSPYVMFVDSDAELSPGCIAILRDNIDIFGWVGIHAMLLLSSEDTTYWQRAVHNLGVGLADRPGPRPHIGTCVAMFRRETVLEHPFDPGMKYAAEDADLCLRLRKYGYIVGVTRAYAYHHNRPDFYAVAKQQFLYGIGIAQLVLKYKSVRLFVRPALTAVSAMPLIVRARMLEALPYKLVTTTIQYFGMIVGLSKAFRYTTK
jgi:glycosyltransferase involved in cell wall biosynthesis